MLKIQESTLCYQYRGITNLWFIFREMTVRVKKARKRGQVAVMEDFNYQQSTGTLGGGNKLEAGDVWFLT